MQSEEFPVQISKVNSGSVYDTTNISISSNLNVLEVQCWLVVFQWLPQKYCALFVYTLSVGMNNLGSTCYLNSFIQCFTANLGVTQGLLSIKFTKEEKQNVTSIPAFLELK